MFRVGIIGSENSHAMAFARIFNGLEEGVSYPDIRVTAVGGHYPEESRKVFDACGLDFIAETPEEMLGRVDAVMITARDGRFHGAFARPFIEAGLPAFIDKPFTSDYQEAISLARLAKEKGVPLVGGSSVKYAPQVLELKQAVESGALGKLYGGEVSAPVNMHNEYGGFLFYASHLAEVSLTVFGYNPKSVAAFRQGDNLVIVTRYEDFLVTGHYNEGNYNYAASVYGKEGTLQREIDLSAIYRSECDSFARMLRTGEMDHSYDQLVKPVLYLNAIERALETGREVEIGTE